MTEARPGDAAPRDPPGTAWLLLAMVVVALNLRPLIASVPPLITTISKDLGVGSAVVGVVTTLSLLAMAVFAPVAIRLNRRYAASRVVLFALVLTLAGSLLRLGSGSLVVLYLSTLVGGVGIALIGAMLPGIVRRSFAGRAGLATGLYTVGLTAGATAASALSVPLADALGSWPVSLAAWGLLGVLGLAFWVPTTRQDTVSATDAALVALPWRQRRAWVLVAWMTGSSVLFYAMLTWLSPYYEDLGWTERDAGFLLGSFSLWQILASLALPALADRRADRRAWLLLAAGCLVVGTAMTTWAPLAAPWVGVGLLAVGSGGVFSLGLTLLVDFAATPEESSSLSALCFLVCYSTAAVATPLVGLVRDGTGSLTPALVALFVVALAMVPLGFALRPRVRVT